MSHTKRTHLLAKWKSLSEKLLDQANLLLNKDLIGLYLSKESELLEDFILQNFTELRDTEHRNNIQSVLNTVIYGLQNSSRLLESKAHSVFLESEQCASQIQNLANELEIPLKTDFFKAIRHSIETIKRDLIMFHNKVDDTSEFFIGPKRKYGIYPPNYGNSGKSLFCH